MASMANLSVGMLICLDVLEQTRRGIMRIILRQKPGVCSDSCNVLKVSAKISNSSYFSRYLSAENICPPCLQKPILNNEGLTYHPTYPGKDFVPEINGDKTGEPYLLDGHSLHTLHRETYRPAPLKSRQRFNQHRNLITCGLEIAIPTTLPALPLPREMGLSRQ